MRLKRVARALVDGRFTLILLKVRFLVDLCELSDCVREDERLSCINSSRCISERH